MAHELHSKVIRDNVAIEVKGMHDRNLIRSKVVEVSVIVNHKQFTIQAFVVPDINIAFNVPELDRIVECVTDAGLTLADYPLKTSENILAGFDFVMGPDSLSMLEPNAKLIGKGPIKSSLLITTAGAMLIGDPDLLLKNLSEYNLSHITENDNLTENDKETKETTTSYNPDYVLDSYSCLADVTERMAAWPLFEFETIYFSITQQVR